MRRLAVFLLALAWPAAAAEPRTPEEKIKLFNGWNLEGFTVFLRDNGPNDPRRVFTVRAKKIVVSGVEWGALTTVDEWRDYKLTVEWRWGGKAWPPREKRARDSGILLHGVGEFNPKQNGWLESYEYQIIEGGTGDMIPVAGAGRQGAVRFLGDRAGAVGSGGRGAR